MAETPKLKLPKITGNMSWDVVRDLNALADAVDGQAGAAGGIALLGADGKLPGDQISVDLSALATKTEVAGKVDKVAGKQLSSEDYTQAEKAKLAGVEVGANKYTHPTTHPPSIIAQNASNRFVTDAEKANWSGKETQEGAQAKVDALGGSGNTKTVKQVDDAVSAHLKGEITDGAMHGMRVTDGKLEYFDGDKWQRVKGDGYPVGNVKDFATAAGNAEIKLTWQDPSDVTVTDSNGSTITIARWAGTKILRKTGSYPANENDGVLVVDNGVRDQYRGVGFTDSGLTNGTSYYYSAFPYTEDDMFTVDSANRANATPQAIRFYALEWNQSKDIVSRTQHAADMAPSDFGSAFPWKDIVRCNLSDSGVVKAYNGEPLYKDDGSNGQVMVEIPKFWFKKTVKTVGSDRVIEFAISDSPATGFGVHPAFFRDRNGDGAAEEVDKRYYSAFEGVNVGGKLESKAGVASTVSQTIATFRNQAQARGNGWGITDFNLLYAVQVLYLIEYGHFDSQTTIGKGITSDSAKHSTGETTGLGNTTGQGAGADGKRAMSYRGIENWYGNIRDWIDGCYYEATVTKIGNVGFNDTGAGYKSVAYTNPAAGGSTSDVQDSQDLGFIPKAFNGSSYQTHLYDYGYVLSGRLPSFGGDWSDGANAGAFSLSSHAASASASNLGARLAF